MSKAIKLITILICLVLCLLGCAPSPSSSIEEMIDGTYTIIYIELHNKYQNPTPYEEIILGELQLANGEYTFTAAPESLEHFPLIISPQLPMLENTSGTYTLSLRDEFKNKFSNDLPKTEDTQNLGTIIFSSQDEPYIVQLRFSEGQQTISIDAWIGCIQLWSIGKTIP